MDELKALEILHLSKDAGKQEIRKAYSTLSKQYHPEEFPEQFQTIHDAYLFLTRRNHQNIDLQEKQPEPPVQPKIDELDFDSVLVEEQKRKQQQFDANRQQALAELEALLQSKQARDVEEYRTFFDIPAYHEVVYDEAFMQEMAYLLEADPVSQDVARYIYSFYRFKGLDSSQFHDGAYVLSETLTSLMNAPVYQPQGKLFSFMAIVFGFVFGLMAFIVYDSRHLWMMLLMSVIHGFLVYGTLRWLQWLYQKLCEIYDWSVAQSLVTLGTLVGSVVIMLVLVDVIDDMVIVELAALAIVSLIWMILASIMALVRKVRGKY